MIFFNRKLILLSLIILCLQGCMSFAPQVTSLKSVSSDQAIVFGRLLGSVDRPDLFFNPKRGIIFFHKFTSVNDIPILHVDWRDITGARVKNNNGTFVVSLPPGQYYISAIGYGTQYAEYDRKGIYGNGSDSFLVLNAKPGSVTYIGDFFIEGWVPVDNSLSIKFNIAIKNDCSRSTLFLASLYPDFSLPVVCDPVSVKHVEK